MIDRQCLKEAIEPVDMAGPCLFLASAASRMITAQVLDRRRRHALTLQPAFAAVDWGTTSFRLWLMAESGEVLGERRSPQGLTALRREEFSGVLEAHLDALGAPADLPVVVCGMAGSRQGWTEARYLDVPARLDDVVEQRRDTGGRSAARADPAGDRPACSKAGPTSCAARRRS